MTPAEVLMSHVSWRLQVIETSSLSHEVAAMKSSMASPLTHTRSLHRSSSSGRRRNAAGSSATEMEALISFGTMMARRPERFTLADCQSLLLEAAGVGLFRLSQLSKGMLALNVRRIFALHAACWMHSVPRRCVCLPTFKMSESLLFHHCPQFIS